MSQAIAWTVLGLVVFFIVEALLLILLLLSHPRGFFGPVFHDPVRLRRLSPDAARVWRMLGSPLRPGVPALTRILAELELSAEAAATGGPSAPLLRRLGRVHPEEVFAAWRHGGSAALIDLWRRAL